MTKGLYTILSFSPIHPLKPTVFESDSFKQPILSQDLSNQGRVGYDNFSHKLPTHTKQFWRFSLSGLI